MPGLRRVVAGLAALLLAAAPMMGHVLMATVHGADMPASMASAVAGPHGAAAALDGGHHADDGASGGSSAHLTDRGCPPDGLISCVACGLVCHVAALPPMADDGVALRPLLRPWARSDIPDGLPPDAPPRPPKATA